MSPSLASPPASSCSPKAVNVDDEYCATAKRYHRRFYAAAFRILRNHDEAEDAIQQAHARALAHLHQFSGRAALSTWLMHIVVNEALMQLRRRVPLVDLNGVHLQSTVCDPEEQAVRGQLRTRILAGIQALPPHYRTVFLVRQVWDMTTVETAAYLGLTVECTKTRLHRAKLILREQLGSQMGAGGTFGASAAGRHKRRSGAESAESADTDDGMLTPSAAAPQAKSA
jgi:RNA polymerase sigma-70 factor (ECF subfamily)